jgi:iron complex transport system permease protein
MKRLRAVKIGYLYTAAVSMTLLSAVLGVLLGATRLNALDAFFAMLNGDAANTDLRILLYVRLPRILAGLVCGMALAVSGAVIQGVLANRLASPSIIGVNSGAGLAVTVCSAFGLLGGWRVSLAAFLGAFLSVMLVSIGAKKWGASGGTVILMGVALNAILGAISDAVTAFIPEVSMMRNDFRIGDFSAVTYRSVIPAAALTVTAVLILVTLAGELDVLTLGDDNARALGLRTDRARVILLLLSALLAGAAVSVCGLLSFVGLLVPHAVRRVGVSEARHLLPLCALFGGGFVSLCDTLARTVFAPYELPVGIIMAFLGAPFFIAILIRRTGGALHD